MIVTDSREGAGSDLGNPEFSFLNFHFAFLAAGSTLGIVDAKPALSTFECHSPPYFVFCHQFLSHLLSAMFAVLKLTPLDNAGSKFT